MKHVDFYMVINDQLDTGQQRKTLRKNKLWFVSTLVSATITEKHLLVFCPVCPIDIFIDMKPGA